MELFIIIFLLAILLNSWILITERKFSMLRENVRNSVNQIGVQLCSCFDMLIKLAYFLEDAKGAEGRELTAAITAGRSEINARSTAEEVARQNEIIEGVYEKALALGKKDPELRAQEGYLSYTDAVERYRQMLKTGFLIYNDSAGKMNQLLKRFPYNFTGRILGFYPEAYLPVEDEQETEAEK